VFTPHLYQRLPHPISHLLKELDVADGTRVDILCEFLLKVIKIREIWPLNDTATYELMYLHCRGELLCSVEHANKTREKFDNFHVRLLRQFIPSQQTAQLRLGRYERVQKEGESFPMYVQSIKDATIVLRIEESEAQVVKRVVEGLTSTPTRSFCFPSSTFLLQTLGKFSNCRSEHSIGGSG
jgi:hypothetical protein